MLSKILLHNFQKHQKKLIKFDSKITVITGNTDRGKSSIIRSLRWLCFNRPSSGLATHGEKQSEVCALIDGIKVVRAKGKENFYAIGKKKFKAIGSDVPEEIKSLIKITETNFQMQFDPLFWITDSPAQISKNLNKIIDLESIDKAIKIASRQHNEAKSYLKVYASKCREKQEKRKKFEWFQKAGDEFGAIEELQTKLKNLKASEALLHDVIEGCRRGRIRHQKATQALSEAQKWREQLAQLAQLNTQLEKLSKLTIQIKSLKKQTKSLKIKQEQVETNLQKMRKGKCPICGKTM